MPKLSDVPPQQTAPSRSLSQRGAALFLTAVVSSLCGCGGAEYPLAPVSGVVTLDGEPLAGAAVVFQPKPTESVKKPAPGSVARTDDQGRYTLATVNDEPGAALGRHRVRIYSYSPESAPVSDVDTEDVQELVPERYNYRSELFFEVEPEGTDAADFSLTTDGSS